MPSLPVEVVAYDHVAIACHDASVQARMLSDVLGATYFNGGVAKGFRWLQFAFPGGRVELVEPVGPDSFLHPFLAKRGPGLHHMTLRVADLSGSLEGLAAAGYRPVDVDLSHDDWKEAFLHPRDTGGVLIQLAEVPPGEYPPPSEVVIPLEQLLDGRL